MAGPCWERSVARTRAWDVLPLVSSSPTFPSFCSTGSGCSEGLGMVRSWQGGNRWQCQEQLGRRWRSGMMSPRVEELMSLLQAMEMKPLLRQEGRGGLGGVGVLLLCLLTSMCSSTGITSVAPCPHSRPP